MPINIEAWSDALHEILDVPHQAARQMTASQLLRLQARLAYFPITTSGSPEYVQHIQSLSFSDITTGPLGADLR